MLVERRALVCLVCRGEEASHRSSTCLSRAANCVYQSCECVQICEGYVFESIIVTSLTDERLMSREKALGIALGNINPITGEVIANFSPCKTKVSNSLLDNDENDFEY